jgi:hypothetical protein
MAVPKASLDFDYGPVFWQDYVWAARQTGIMQPESVAKLMQCAAYGDFGLGILRPYQRHHLGALRRAEHIVAGRHPYSRFAQLRTADDMAHVIEQKNA